VPEATPPADGLISEGIDEVDDLMVEGREQGYLDVDHIYDVLQEIELDADQIDDFLLALHDIGVEVIEAQDGRQAGDRRPGDADRQAASGAGKEQGARQLDLTPTTWSLDPVRMYFREIARVPLLTGVQECRWPSASSAAHGGQARADRSNLRLVVSIAKRYARTGMPISTLSRTATSASSARSRSSTTAAATSSRPMPPVDPPGDLAAAADQARTIRIPVHMVEQDQTS